MNICLFEAKELTQTDENSFTGCLKKKDERAQHIVKILHKTAGGTFSAGIIGGAAGTATITSIAEKGSENEGEIAFSFVPETSGKPLYPLTLIIGFPRPIQLRRLLRDIAGLGAKKVILCGTELTEKSYLDSNVVSDGSAYQMLLDGTAQAASTHVPKLVFYKSLSEMLRFESGNDGDSGSEIRAREWDMTSKIALDNRRATESLHDFLKQEGAHSVIAAIGSERGWTEAERDLLEQNGFTLCSMGTRILRTETAATVASSIILDSMGFLQ